MKVATLVKVGLAVVVPGGLALGVGWWLWKRYRDAQAQAQPFNAPGSGDATGRTVTPGDGYT